VSRRLATLAVVLALGSIVVASGRALQAIPKEDVLGKRLLYLPTPEILKLASLGNQGLMADLLYMWSIQYYSQFELDEKFLYLETVFELVTDLDPRYFDAYRIGALIMSLQKSGDPAQHKAAVVRLYDKGLANMPDSWELAEVAAWDAHLVLNDQELAVRWMKAAAERPGAPPEVKRVYGRWRDNIHGWTIEDSIAYWEGVVAEATRKADINLATSHLYDSYATLHRGSLDPLLAGFRRRTGTCPESWQELVEQGLLPEVPLDYLGNPYGVDPSTCTLVARKRIRWD
jgi:hypothetical protein